MIRLIRPGLIHYNYIERLFRRTKLFKRQFTFPGYWMD
jgi:hypothetical protein